MSNTRGSCRQDNSDTCQPVVGEGGIVPKIQNTFVRLLRFLFLAIANVVPSKTPAKDVGGNGGDQLFADVQDDVKMKERIAKIAESLRSEDGENQTSGEKSKVAALLARVVESLRSQEPFPLSSTESQKTVDVVEQLMCSQGDKSTCRTETLKVLLWISLRTSKYPQEMTITQVLESPGREDYGNQGMNDVFKGRYRGKYVAFKRPRVIGMVQPSRKKELQDLKAFYRRSLVAFSMQNDHVLPLLGIVDDPACGGFSMILPWMENGDLRSFQQRLITEGKLVGQGLMDIVQKWIFDTADGLFYLHFHGVTHGDIRGANILVDAYENIRLTAFGSTTLASADNFSPVSGNSIPWIAPELIDPKRHKLESASSTQASDVYSFACTCVELYSCQTPFQGMSDAQILQSVVKGQRPQKPYNLGFTVPEPIWNIVTKCWDPTPSKRPAVSDVVHMLSVNGSMRK